MRRRFAHRRRFVLSPTTVDGYLSFGGDWNRAVAGDVKRSRLVRDDEGAWASASPSKRALGLVVSLLLALVLLAPLVLIVYFLLNR
jgi:hypothetical protein